MSLLKILKDGFSESVTAEDFPTIADRLDGINEQLAKIEENLKNGKKNSEYYTVMGLQQLSRELYKEALDCFMEAIKLLSANNNDGDIFFYAAICFFNGKRPFLTQLSTIKKVEQYLANALKHKNSGAYYYLKYLIYSDFYEKRKLRCSPSSHELLEYAEKNNVSENDKKQIQEWLGL